MLEGRALHGVFTDALITDVDTRDTHECADQCAAQDASQCMIWARVKSTGKGRMGVYNGVLIADATSDAGMRCAAHPSGDLYYVRSPNDMSYDTATNTTMWAITASRPVTVYIDVLAGAQCKTASPEALSGNCTVDGPESWLTDENSGWVQQSFHGTAVNMPSTHTYTLGEDGAQDCPVDTTPVSQRECAAAAKAMVPDEIAQGGTNLQLVVSTEAGWNYAPAGCSVSVSGDWLAHYNYASVDMNSNLDGVYRVVCKMPQPERSLAMLRGGNVYKKEFPGGTINLPGSGVSDEAFCTDGIRSGITCCASSCGVCGRGMPPSPGEFPLVNRGAIPDGTRNVCEGNCGTDSAATRQSLTNAVDHNL